MRASTVVASEGCCADSHVVGFLGFTALHTYTGSRRETGLDDGGMVFIALGKDGWDRGVISRIVICVLSEYRYARYVIF